MSNKKQKKRNTIVDLMCFSCLIEILCCLFEGEISEWNQHDSQKTGKEQTTIVENIPDLCLMTIGKRTNGRKSNVKNI